jgi:methylglyoxal synthase
MTFGETVINVVNLSATQEASGTTTLYTVPAGRYAQVSINSFTTGGTGGDIRISGSGMDKALVPKLFFLAPGQSVTLVASGPGNSITARGCALEFNLP